MLRRNVYEHFGIYAEEIYQAGLYTAFSANGERYLLVPDPGHSKKEWEEKIRWVQQLFERGEELTAVYVPPLKKKFSVPIDGYDQLLFKMPNIAYERRSHWRDGEGEMLGAFHQRAATLFPPQSTSFFVERWCRWWIQRMEQLESWYGEVRKKTHFTEMDRWFIQTLPYYIGRTENAIQYIRESLEGLDQVEYGTICHMQWTPTTWVVLDEQVSPIKIPADWLFDHPSRDIAEWIRYEWSEDTDVKRIKRFMDGYEANYRFTPFMRRLVFGRLLFPYHYAEQVERFYLLETTVEEEKALEFMYHLWDREAKDMEQLSSFLKMEVPSRDKEPHWLWSITENGY